MINVDNNDIFIQNSYYLNSDMDKYLKISENILECTTINRLFYYLCEFFCELSHCNIAQGIIIIGNEYYFISEFNLNIRQFKPLDYIPLIKVNEDFRIIYDALNTEFKQNHKCIKYEILASKYSLPTLESFKNNIFVPLYCKDSLYGFILIDKYKFDFLESTTFLSFVNFILLQASISLNRIFNNDINLYLNNDLNINHPLLNSKIKEQESFTCITSMDGYIINCSQGSYNVLRYKNIDLLTTSIFDYIHPLHKEIFINEYKNMLSSKKPYNSRILMINNNKTYTWVKFTCKYSYDEDNIVNGIYFYIANHDYSDEAILTDLNNSIYKDSIDDINLLFSSNSKGIFMVRNLSIIYANEVAMKYLNINSLEDYFGKDFNDFFLFDSIENQLYTNKSFKIEDILNFNNPYNVNNFNIEAIRKKDNKSMEFNFFVSPIANSVFKDTMIIIIDCKNHIDENEELRKSIAEKTELLNNALKCDKIRCDFFANISHELRTPVNVIYSALQLLNIELPNYIDSFHNSTVNKRVKTMKQNCYRLIKLINNLIDATKIDAGYYQLFLGKYNIVALIEDITMSIAQYVEDKGIRMIFDTDIEEKITYCDAEKIERILLNLISNAIKFTDKNGEINISLKDKGSYLLVSVSDTGAGIPKDKCDSIFQRFVQVDCNRKNEKEGSGIGLSLVKSLIEMHKGQIWVDSDIGKGSIFTFKLPYCYAPEAISSNVITDTSFREKDRIQTIEIEFSDIYL